MHETKKKKAGGGVEYVPAAGPIFPQGGVGVGAGGGLAGAGKGPASLILGLAGMLGGALA